MTRDPEPPTLATIAGIVLTIAAAVLLAVLTQGA